MINNKSFFWPILGTHIFLLIGTGYIAFIHPPSLGTLATPTEIMAIEKAGPDFKKDYLDDLRISRERATKIVNLSSQSFHIILGSLLSFLASVSAQNVSNSSSPFKVGEKKAEIQLNKVVKEEVKKSSGN